MRDKLPARVWKNESGVVNLDSFANSGTHWVSYMKLANVIHYYDSFALIPPRDRVRIALKKDLFSDKYDRKWGREIFLINKIDYTDPITYSIKALDAEDILGKFYPEGLPPRDS